MKKNKNERGKRKKIMIKRYNFLICTFLVSLTTTTGNKKTQIFDIAETLYCKKYCGPTCNGVVLYPGMATVCSTINIIRSSFDGTSLIPTIQTGLNVSALVNGIIAINCMRFARENSVKYFKKMPSKKENFFKTLSLISSSVSLYLSCTNQNPDLYSTCLNIGNGVYSLMNMATVTVMRLRDSYFNSDQTKKIDSEV